jgi:hypothetical protein
MVTCWNMTTFLSLILDAVTTIELVDANLDALTRMSANWCSVVV